MGRKPIAVIIGGGPAGLTAAYELVTRSDIKPLVVEADDQLGGISRTVNYKGNRIDIGGHRFFSKSTRVMEWWGNMLPLQGKPAADHGVIELSYQNRRHSVRLDPGGPDPEREDPVMLIRPRVSRILFRGRLFDYPLKPSPKTLWKLGIGTSLKIIASYAGSRLAPIRPERSLEDFFINRFGRTLYSTFFREYTEKVWGVPCDQIPAEWGAQRIKGLSVTAVIKHALTSLWSKAGALSQKSVETSLIEQFMYPKYGPGHLWERVGERVEEHGGEIRLGTRVTALRHDGSGHVRSVIVRGPTGSEQEISADWFFTTMPLCDLIGGISPPAPEPVREVADGLVYRDFMTVGLLLKKLKLGGNVTGKTLYSAVPDNWIYVQEPDVKLGRLQIFNNWSPYMVADPERVWVGLEYFVNEGDELWSMADADMIRFAVDELERIGVAERRDVIDHTLIRVPKTYPAYFGSYDRFHLIRGYLDQFENLFPLGRNGMHRYNNQDHSMLTAMVAVDNILAGVTDKANLWEVNTESEYHEEESASS